MKLIISISTRPEAGFDTTSFTHLEISLKEKDGFETNLAVASQKVSAFIKDNIAQALKNHNLATGREIEE